MCRGFSLETGFALYPLLHRRAAGARGPCRRRVQRPAARPSEMGIMGANSSLRLGTRPREVGLVILVLRFARLCSPGMRGLAARHKAQQPRRSHVSGFLLRGMVRFNGGPCGDTCKGVPVPCPVCQPRTVCHPFLGRIGRQVSRLVTRSHPWPTPSPLAHARALNRPK